MNGIVLYEGPSLIDGDPIVAIMTGLRGSSNPKTGSMLQTWILRSDMHPVDALSSGADYSICGGCPHRPQGKPKRGKRYGSRACYVNPMSFGSVFKAYQAGKYIRTDATRSYTAGRYVRLGSYGDPAAVPFGVWRNLVRGAIGHTGYTHQWRDCDSRLRRLCMASVDTESDYQEAKRAGWRCFRVRGSADPILSTESVCPASDEAGKLTTCMRCRLCSGSFEDRANPPRDISIVVHGAGARNFQPLTIEGNP